MEGFASLLYFMSFLYYKHRRRKFDRMAEKHGGANKGDAFPLGNRPVLRLAKRVRGWVTLCSIFLLSSMPATGTAPVWGRGRGVGYMTSTFHLPVCSNSEASTPATVLRLRNHRASPWSRPENRR